MAIMSGQRHHLRLISAREEGQQWQQAYILLAVMQQAAGLSDVIAYDLHQCVR